MTLDHYPVSSSYVYLVRLSSQLPDYLLLGYLFIVSDINDFGYKKINFLGPERSALSRVYFLLWCIWGYSSTISYQESTHKVYQFPILLRKPFRGPKATKKISKGISLHSIRFYAWTSARFITSSFNVWNPTSTTHKELWEDNNAATGNLRISKMRQDGGHSQRLNAALNTATSTIPV